MPLSLKHLEDHFDYLIRILGLQIKKLSFQYKLKVGTNSSERHFLWLQMIANSSNYHPQLTLAQSDLKWPSLGFLKNFKKRRLNYFLRTRAI